MLNRVKNVYDRYGLKRVFFAGVAKALKKSSSTLFQIGEYASLAAGNCKFFLTQAERGLLQKNGIFKDKHKGKRCFVIGNGPSLKTQDLSPLTNEITFVMSAFWKHPLVGKWQPTYYCFVDPFFFDKSEPIREFFKTLTNRIHNSIFFVPIQAKEIIQEQGLLTLERTYYVAFDNALNENPIRQIELAKRIPYVMTVAQLAIIIAMYMGCSPIYLLGVDDDYLSHRGVVGHFYDGHAGLEKHPEFYPNLTHWSYKYLMECQLKLWRAYEKLQMFSGRNEIRILNATMGGFLDVFEQTNYEQLVRSQ